MEIWAIGQVDAHTEKMDTIKRKLGLMVSQLHRLFIVKLDITGYSWIGLSFVADRGLNNPAMNGGVSVITSLLDLRSGGGGVCPKPRLKGRRGRFIAAY
jgi:hypothetical protein